VWIDHPVDVHRVEMTAEQERASTTCSTRAEDDARPGSLADDVDSEACCTPPVGDERGGLSFPGTAVDERRVDGVDRNELRREDREITADQPILEGSRKEVRLRQVSGVR
jgi:hypothetical protein